MPLFGGLDFGIAQGLAYRHDFQADIRNRLSQEQVDRQSRIDAENRAKLFGEELETTAVSNPWDNKLLQDLYQKKFTEIGQFVSENPDFRQDPGLFIQYDNMTRGLLDNEIVQRAMRYESQNKLLSKYVSETEGAKDDPHIQEMLKQSGNYSSLGSSDGITGNGREFTFTAPSEQIDVVRELQAIGNRFKEQKFQFNSALGGIEGTADKNAIAASARGAMNDPRLKQSILDRFASDSKAGVTNAATPLDYVKEVITSGTPTSFKPIRTSGASKTGWYNALLGSGQSPWKHDIQNKSRATGIPQQALQKALGDIGAIYMFNNPGSDGKQDMRFFGKRKVEYTGNMETFLDPLSARVDANGKAIPDTERNQKYFEVITEIPWEDAVGADIGLYWDFNNEEGSGDIEDRWKGFAERTKNEKGDWVARILAYVPVDPTRESTRIAFDNAVGPAKLVQPAIPDSQKASFLAQNFSADQMDEIMDSNNILPTDVDAIDKLFNIVTGGQ